MEYHTEPNTKTQINQSLHKVKDGYQRRYYLDWLRVLAVILLVYFHSAAVFYVGSLGEFYIRNNQSSPGAIAFILFIHQWHMPLFFLISGAATCLAFEHRTAQQYIAERFKRLFVPFMFGILILVPPQVYYRLLSKSIYYSSYLQFYPHFFDGVRPKGNFEWSQLWFIVYLFTFSLAALPLFIYLKESGKIWLSKFVSLVEKPGAIFLLAIPLAAIEAALRPRWPGFQNLYDDWANFLLYISYFIYGYIVCSDLKFEHAIDRHLKIALSMAIASLLILFGLWKANILPEQGYSLGYILYQMLRGFNSWLWVIVIIGLARKYLNFSNKLLVYLNEASYPIFLLHQTILVPTAFYVVQLNITIIEKFILISTISLTTTIIVYDLLIKRSNILRFFFGLKQKN